MSKFSFKKKGANKSRKDIQRQENQSPPKMGADIVEDNQIPISSDIDEESAAKSKNFALKFAFLKDKLKADAKSARDNSTGTSPQNNQTGSAPDEKNKEQTTSKTPTITPGSNGEHLLQEKWGARDRALNFYNKQVLDYLAPKMQEFIARQEFLFVATADRNGECDCTSKFGKPGFIRVLSNKYRCILNTGAMAYSPIAEI